MGANDVEACDGLYPDLVARLECFCVAVLLVVARLDALLRMVVTDAPDDA